MPFRDVAGLIAYAKANPGMVNFGTGSPRSSGSIAVALMNEALGTDFNPIPYKGGAPLLIALIGAQIQAGTISTAYKQQLDAGKIVALTISTAERMTMYPNVPTVKEAGLPYL